MNLEPYFTVLFDSSSMELPANVLQPIERIDGGWYWKVTYADLVGYVIHSPLWQAELRRLGKI